MKKILFVLLISSPLITLGATEDFTGFTEVDTDGKITITSDKVDIAAINEGNTDRVYRDDGAAYWDGNFEFLFEVYINSSGVDGIHAGHIGLFNESDNKTTTVDDDGIYTRFYTNAANAFIDVVEWDEPNQYSDRATVNLDTLYYLTLERDEAVGSYGTIYLYIYSDATRETLVDTLSIALHTDKKDFRYLYAFLNYGNEVGAYTYTGYVQDLDLQEATPTPTPAFLQASSTATSTDMMAAGFVGIAALLFLWLGIMITFSLYKII